MEHHFNRRRFLFGTGGLLLPWPAYGAAWTSPVLKFFVRLAISVGGQIIAIYLKEYLDKQLAESEREVIRRSTEAMSQNSFTDFDHPVYISGEDLLFVGQQQPRKYNACVAFVQRNDSEARLGGMLEGPSVVVLAEAARDAAARFGAEKARNLLIPTKQRMDESMGWFEESYRVQDLYQTRDGRVAIDYSDVKVVEPGRRRGTATLSAFDKRGVEVIKSSVDIFTPIA